MTKTVPSLVSQPLDKDHPHKSVLLPRLTNAELIVLSKTFDHKLAKLKVSHQTFHGTNARRWKPASNERRQKCLTQLLTKLSEDDSAVATDMDEDQMSSREYVCDDWCADQDEDLEADANAFAQGAKNAYLRHFVLKMIILSRQARAKHRENSNTDAFFAGCCAFCQEDVMLQDPGIDCCVLACASCCDAHDMCVAPPSLTTRMLLGVSRSAHQCQYVLMCSPPTGCCETCAGGMLQGILKSCDDDDDFDDEYAAACA